MSNYSSTKQHSVKPAIKTSTRYSSVQTADENGKERLLQTSQKPVGAKVSFME